MCDTRRISDVEVLNWIKRSGIQIEIEKIAKSKSHIHL